MSTDRTEFSFVFNRVVRFLGAADPDEPDGSVIAENSPFTEEAITEQIVQSDLEVGTLIASTPDHPFRSEYFDQDTTTDVSHMGVIPAYVGLHGNVYVRDGVSRFTAKLANSRDHIERIIEKYEIGGDMAVPPLSLRLYWIENGRAFTSMPGGQLEIELPVLPVYDPDDNQSEMLTPQPLANAVIAHALATIAPVGVDAGHRAYWVGLWQMYQRAITGDNAISLPEPEQHSRIAR